jgi:cellulose synthase/poly-beta-1,6-N-acetylglucosamine synthase-like glycosyltransferase
MSTFYLYIVLISIVILFSYALLFLNFTAGLQKLKIESNIDYSEDIKQFISIVIVFRNEEKNIANLLQTLSEQAYDKQNFEVLLFNDNSTDSSVAIVQQFFELNYTINYQLFQLEIKQGESPKKTAINLSTIQAKGCIIAITDADCVVKNNWLNSINKQLQNNKLVIGPIAIKNENSWIEKLQQIEINTLSACSAAAIGNQKVLMCSAANMAFNKNDFIKLNPYKNNMQIASGDDIFLLESMSKSGSQGIAYNAHVDALVFTLPEPNLTAYLSQKTRWVAKTKYSKNNYVLFVGVIVLLMHISILCLVIFSLLFYKFSIIVLLFILATKTLFDFAVLKLANPIFKSNISYFKIFSFQIMESLLSLLVFIAALKGNYIWKDRKHIDKFTHN